MRTPWIYVLMFDLPMIDAISNAVQKSRRNQERERGPWGMLHGWPRGRPQRPASGLQVSQALRKFFHTFPLNFPGAHGKQSSLRSTRVLFACTAGAEPGCGRRAGEPGEGRGPAGGRRGSSAQRRSRSAPPARAPPPRRT